MAKKLLSPDDARDFLLRKFSRNHTKWLAGQGIWPLVVTIGMPTEREVSEDASGVREWVQAWREYAGPGRLEWRDRQFGRLGTHGFPARLVLDSALDVAAAAGHEARWALAATRYADMVARWPALGNTDELAARFSVLADYPPDEFDRLVALLAWIERHPCSGATLRQLPVPGLDTKWLETRTGLVGSLLRLVLGSEETDFYALTGLKRAAHRVRIRILCPALRARVGGLGDIEAPVLELAALPIRPTAIIAVENQETGAALPDIDGAVAVLKLGNAVSVLRALPWIRDAVAIYWGDIDTHGFAILHRAREALPHLRSILMDEQTLLARRDLWGMEPVQCPNGSFDLLTPEELSVYEGLRANRWGVRLRMEQERVSWELALDALHEALRL